MTGNGVTRIDTLLANQAAAQLTEGVSYDYDNNGPYDHAAVAASFGMDGFNDNVQVQVRPENNTLTDMKSMPQRGKRKKHEQDADFV